MRQFCHVWRKSDLPIVVEIVDIKEKLEKFLESIEGGISAGLVTLEKAQIRFYRSTNVYNINF